MARTGTRVRLRPERATIAVVVVMAVGAMPLALSSPYLLTVLLVPLGVLVWALRARVEAGDDGLVTCNGLRVRHTPWEQVAGFEVPDHGPVRLLRRGERPLRLTAATRRTLPQVLEASPRS